MTIKKDPEEEAKKQKEEKRENLVAIVIVVLAIAVVGWFVYAALNPAPPDEDPELRYDISFGVSPRIGEDQAPVLVFQFSDFECPFCAQFGVKEWPKVKEEYIETGKVLFVYKYFPLTNTHPKAMGAAQAAACADSQNKFWEYHDILYANFQALEIGQLKEYADEAGLDLDRFEECFNSGTKLAEVQLDMQEGIDNAVAGTPTFFFNGRKVQSYMTAEQFGTEVEKELALLEHS